MFNRFHQIDRILLIRRKALGDCLVSLPGARELQRIYPQAKIDMIIDAPFAPLLSLLAPDICIIPWNNKNASPLDFLKWYQKLWSKNYDLVIDWLGNPRTALWAAATGARFRIGYDLPRRRWAYNLVSPRNKSAATQLQSFAGEAFLDPLRTMGLSPESWGRQVQSFQCPALPSREMSTQYRTWRDKWLPESGVKIALMMSATWPAKAWPVKQVFQLMNQLISLNYKPLFIPGPGDEKMENILKTRFKSEFGSLDLNDFFAPPTTLIELADLLSHCQVFAGTDCGGRHLAAVMGLPTVTVFGPTDSEGWNLNSPRFVSVQKDLDCLGCDYKICPLPEHPCMEKMSAHEVVTGLQRILQLKERQSDGRNN